MGDENDPLQIRKLSKRPTALGQLEQNKVTHASPINVPGNDERYSENLGSDYEKAIGAPARGFRPNPQVQTKTPRLRGSDDMLPYDALSLLATVLFRQLAPEDQAEARPVRPASELQLKQSTLDEAFSVRTKQLPPAAKKELIGLINDHLNAHHNMHSLMLDDPLINKMLKGKDAFTEETARRLGEALDQGTQKANAIKSKVAASMPQRDFPVEEMQGIAGFNGFNTSGPSAPEPRNTPLPGMHRTKQAAPSPLESAVEGLIKSHNMNSGDAAQLREAMQNFNRDTDGKINIPAIVGIIGQKSNVTEMSQALQKFSSEIEALSAPANTAPAHGLPAHTPAPGGPSRSSRGSRFP